jgi:hypothetical protein
VIILTKRPFWLTGAQQFKLMEQVTESLAGRIAILHVQGLKIPVNNELLAYLGKDLVPIKTAVLALPVQYL